MGDVKSFLNALKKDPMFVAVHLYLEEGSGCRALQ